MVCAHCGTTCDAGQRFCYSCGAQLSLQTSVAPTQMVAPPSTTAQPFGSPFMPSQYQLPTQYQQPPTGYSPYIVQNSNMAIASLIFGVIAWMFLPLIGAIIAVVTGHIGRHEIRQSGGRLAGNGLTVFGMILGYSQLALIGLGGCFLLLFLLVAVA